MARNASPAARLVQAADELSAACERLRFAAPVACTYNPLQYARRGWEAYASRYGDTPKDVVLVGMNPGPFGMAQTGVPFGHVGMVRDWMGICVPVGTPARQHPKRPVSGFACTRSEVSGSRLWGWARDRFGAPERFFARFFVLNYCPLAFMEDSGRNLTPDKLPAAERAALFAACDEALAACLDALSPRWVLGVGGFAAARAQVVREVIAPALIRGAIVLSDRFLDSSTVYQGIGRNLAADPVSQINRFAVGNVMPDLTIVVDVPTEVGLARVRQRASDLPDRMERENIDFYKKIREGYLVLAKGMPDRVVVVDGTLNQDALEKKIWSIVKERIG